MVVLQRYSRPAPARRRAQIGRHHLRARKLLHAVTDSGIALDLRVRAHTDQLRNVHEAVFKDRFGDHAGPFRYRVKQRELGLHIGREARVRRGTHVDRFRTVAVHIEADPVFARFDVSPASRSFASTASGIRLRVTAEDLAAGNRRGHRKSGFNTVRQHTVDAAARRCTPSMVMRSLPWPVILRPARSGSWRYRQSPARERRFQSSFLRKRRCAHDGYGGADAHLIHHNMRAFQATADRGFDITFFQFDLGAQLLQTAMQIDRTRADSAAAGRETCPDRNVPPTGPAPR